MTAIILNETCSDAYDCGMPSRILYIVCAALFVTAPLLAENPPIDAPPQKIVTPAKNSPNNRGPDADRVLPHERPTFKNYLIPAVEIPAFEFALNQVDRVLFTDGTFDTTFASGWDHVVNGKWVVDQDAFAVNQIGHPYQGTVYYTAARSAGLNFWESWVYSNAGSYLWETYGERSDPSINDQVASGTGGALLGEPLYRLCNLIMEGGGSNPGFLRTLGATIISPPTMLNRFLFGEKYGPTLESRDPALFIRIDAGAAHNDLIEEPRNARPISRRAGVGRLRLDYGAPGKEDYRYKRPFDYFHVDVSGTANGGHVYDDLSVRGLLFGTDYQTNGPLTGIWGLYGHFDYESPQIFRFSTTAVSFGSTSQWNLGSRSALLGTALAGVGYASAGTITPANSQNDFHYGATPQGLLALNLVLNDRLSLNGSGRIFFITDHGAGRAPGRERIERLEASVLVRIVEGHAVSLGYDYTSRDAHYDELPSLTQRTGTVSVMYSYVTDAHLGRVPAENQ